MAGYDELDPRVAALCRAAFQLCGWMAEPWACPDCEPIGHHYDRRHEPDCGLAESLDEVYAALDALEYPREPGGRSMRFTASRAEGPRRKEKQGTAANAVTLTDSENGWAQEFAKEGVQLVGSKVESRRNSSSGT